MFQNVVETFLHDAIKRDFVTGPQKAFQVVKRVRELNCRTGADFFNHRYERRAQAKLIEMRRPQVVSDRAHLFQRLRDGVAELRELNPGLLIRQSQRLELRAVFDDQQILAQTVVQCGGDAFALALLRFEQLSREGLLRRLSPFELRDGMPGELLLLKSVKRTPSKRTNPSKGRQPEIAIARLHNVAH